MPRRPYHSVARERFKETLSPEAIEKVGIETGLIRRKRVMTATALFWALIQALGGQKAEYISDVLRTMNAWNDWSIQYKPFWNRLAKPAFAEFTKTLFRKLCQELAFRVLQRQRASCSSFFSAILIDDGSSFAVADGLRKVFPGRFTKIKPAAVELHA